MTEPRRLHSHQTWFLKVPFPILWIGGFAAATVSLFASKSPTDSTAAPEPWMKWQFLVMTIAGTAFIYWTCIRLKFVRMDQEFLYITGLGAESRIPLREVSRVTENRWINIHPVTIHFVHDTEVGRAVVFMPRMRWFAFWSGHPVVDEILDAVHRAGGTPLS